MSVGLLMYALDCKGRCRAQVYFCQRPLVEAQRLEYNRFCVGTSDQTVKYPSFHLFYSLMSNQSLGVFVYNPVCANFSWVLNYIV